MSKRKLIPSISPKEFRKLPKLERIYQWLLHPTYFNLKDEDDKYFRRLREVYWILCDTPNRMEQMARINALIPEANSKYNTVHLRKDCEKLFGDIMEVHKKFDRALTRQRLELIYERAMDQGDLDTARLTIGNIMRLEGLDVHSTEKVDWSQVELPPIEFTDNPKALEAEDIDYEEEE
jgi:hypothetical protein